MTGRARTGTVAVVASVGRRWLNAMADALWVAVAITCDASGCRSATRWPLGNAWRRRLGKQNEPTTTGTGGPAGAARCACLLAPVGGRHTRGCWARVSRPRAGVLLKHEKLAQETNDVAVEALMQIPGTSVDEAQALDAAYPVVPFSS
jgi:hypothetical protein